MSEDFAWWASLRHGGLLISPARLAESFPEGPEPLPKWIAERLRRDLVRLEAGGPDAERGFVATALERVAGLDPLNVRDSRWTRGADVESKWSRRALTGESLKPQHIWHGPNGGILPVFVERREARGGGEHRLGMGRGRRPVARILEWLRGTGEKLAILTNMSQWRLIYAGLDHDAWAEWDTDLWFLDGRPSLQVDALRVLLSPNALTPPEKGKHPPLLAAILDSRRGQAELSALLGERVRQAVELLIQSHSQHLEAALALGVKPRDIYIAATRMVMRMVIVLFAEARDLLPRENAIYHDSYGLQGLREALERSGGGAAPERLRNRFGAWPRVLSLFRLVYEGSHHEGLPVLRYGGGLFSPGDPKASDPVSRAIAVFENPEYAPSDELAYCVLELLCRSQVRVRQGRGYSWVEGPVDFSDLSSEYIGILYEGLLDFELRRAGANDPVVFLAVGDQPALPLSRLEAMTDEALPGLVQKLKQKTKPAAAEDDEAAEGDEADTEDEAESPEVTAGRSTDPMPTIAKDLCDDASKAARDRAHSWARRAVEAGSLVARPRSKKPEVRRGYEAEVDRVARALIDRVIVPREWFLVRWGGTRKGAGTFYTRPQLAVPTVHRTLRPMAYDPPADAEGRPDELAPPSAWTPKRPEEILSLKICDPAMGSGSFLVSGLRFLTDALYASLHHHGRIRATDTARSVVTLAEGKPSQGRHVEELLPCRPEDGGFEPLLRARLKRHVVERCLYGVDLDQLAVELARLALWVETMDRGLPFEFLDHKLKAGNSLVGCWFDRFRDYPVMAWEREGGDKNHTSGVHFEKDAWTRMIRELKTKTIKPNLRMALLSDEVHALFGALHADDLHEEAVKLFSRLHELPIQQAEERAAFYKTEFENSTALAGLRDAFDLWCALWFWPPEQIEQAPLPDSFDKPSDAARQIARSLAQKPELRFFHWELEFPDVFTAASSGFDAVVGNPPWDIQKPSSREFFSNIDPLYRTYEKSEALSAQQKLFTASVSDEESWLTYSGRFKALSNWVKHSEAPFGDGDEDDRHFNLGPGSRALHENWRGRRAQRKSFSDPRHPFRLQGSADLNLYKLFLEAALALLRNGGRLGMIAPSSVYTDKGSAELRSTFVDQCAWQWLFGFENRESIFDIDTRFKFCALIVEKASVTAAIRASFMHRNLEDWAVVERDGVLPYTKAQVTRYSPKNFVILEISERRNLELLEKVYSGGLPLGTSGPAGWSIAYANEFHMTSDLKAGSFRPRTQWEAEGLTRDAYGRWRGRSNETTALPLYEGRMVGAFDFSAKGWVSGRGRGAVWRELAWPEKVIEPQFCMAREVFQQAIASRPVGRGDKVAFMDVASATNERTMISTVLDDVPCGNSAPVLFTSESALGLCFVLNSFVYDYAVRARCGGLHLNYFVIEETPLIPPLRVPRVVNLHVARLAWPATRFAPLWLRLRASGLAGSAWRQSWAVSPHERLRVRCLLDALAAELYGLDEADVRWILKDCDRPVSQLRDRQFTRTLDPKGFWRVDREFAPERRHTLLTLLAFRNLKAMIDAQGGDHERGIAAFCEQNDGDGWLLPETVVLADLGLGHDERAHLPQPVRSVLGERFVSWQLGQTVEESWAECAQHAKAVLGLSAFAQLQSELANETKLPIAQRDDRSVPVSGAAPPQARLFPEDDAPRTPQGKLFPADGGGSRPAKVRRGGGRGKRK